jgi:diguanylate cyclase (GGDEF)-like protein
MTDTPTDTEPTWRDSRFHAIDDSIANLLWQLLLAVGAMFFAFTSSRFVAAQLNISHGFWAFVTEGSLLTVFGCGAIYLTSARPIRSAIKAQRKIIMDSEERLRKEAAQHRFASQVQSAFEMGEGEIEALDVMSRAFTEIVDRPAELLLADSSRAHLRQASVSGCAGGPGCGVETPWACPAVRRGQTLRFASSGALSACPRLAERGSGLSAVCVPVTVLGTPMGVIHMTGGVHDLIAADDVVALETLAQQAGSRIGVLRAMSSAQMQAATDPLTGLVNRRSLESRLHELSVDDVPYAVIVADLDHFKLLNDAHGHDTGDRALRLFADVLRSSVRADDLVCRYGGEEFVLLVPHFDRDQAATIAEQVRERLVAALVGGTVPRFTASFGVADSQQGTTATRVIRAADLAMYDAKNAGRDCVALAGNAKPAMTPEQASDPASVLPAAPKFRSVG